MARPPRAAGMAPVAASASAQMALTEAEAYDRARHDAAMRVVADSMHRRLHGGRNNPTTTESDYKIFQW